MSERPDLTDVPEAIEVPRRRWALQWVWLLPLLAALIGGWLAVRAVLSHGPTVTIRFKTAEGLEAGKTRVKYKDVEVGVVKSVSLADDRAGIIVKAALSKPAEELLVTDTRFWVVRARIAGGTVSGIGTLFSGSYIGLDPGKSKESRRDFEGLETPPVITSDLPGRQFVLRADNIGSLDVGSPVYYRRLEAGRVVAYELDKEGTGILIRIFVNAPYDQQVTPNTRFWHASGVDVVLDANGLKFNTESLVSVLVGGLAFQSPEPAPPQPPSAENSTFTLFADRVAAMKQPVTVAERYALVFRESVRGLAVGAPVDFRGLTVGEVRSIDVDFDRVKREFAMHVEIDFYPERLFRRRARSASPLPDGTPSLTRLVERGLRAQLRSANILTGQLFVAFDFFPGTRKVAMEVAPDALPQVPTVRGSSQELQATVMSIANKLERIPFDEIGTDLRNALQNASTLLLRLDKEIAPEARAALVEARQSLTEARQTVIEARKAIASVERTFADAEPLALQASETLREVGRAAESVRVLSDYLERHPESLIRGKQEDGR